LDLIAEDLDPPRLGRLVELVHDLEVDVRALLERPVELDLPDLAAERRLGELGDREEIVGHAVRGALRIHDLQVEDPVDVYLDVVLRDADLLRDIDRALLQRVPIADRIDERQEDVEPRVQRRAVAPEPFDDERALLRDDHGRAGDHQHDEHREDEEDDHRTGHHPIPSAYSGLSQSVRPSTRVTVPRSPCRRARSPAFRAFHALPRSSAFPNPPGGRSARRIAAWPTRSSTLAVSPPDIQRTSRPRSGTRQASETTEKRNHCAPAVSTSPAQANPPTTMAPAPKNTKKNPPGVRSSHASNPSPRTTHIHHDTTRASGGLTHPPKRRKCQTGARRRTRTRSRSPSIQNTCAPTAAAGTRRSSRPASANATGKTCQSRVVRTNAPMTPTRSSTTHPRPGGLPVRAIRSTIPQSTARWTTVSPEMSSQCPSRDSAWQMRASSPSEQSRTAEATRRRIATATAEGPGSPSTKPPATPSAMPSTVTAFGDSGVWRRSRVNGRDSRR